MKKNEQYSKEQFERTLILQSQTCKEGSNIILQVQRIEFSKLVAPVTSAERTIRRVQLSRECRRPRLGVFDEQEQHETYISN
jgi:hypothetical protein